METEGSGRASKTFALVYEEGTKRQRIRDVYSVFFRPAREADRDAARWARTTGVFDPGVDGGAPVQEQARLVLSAVGPRRDDLIAVPTSKGFVCYMLLPNGGGGCGEPVVHGLTVGGEYGDSEDLLYGLVGDDVRGIDVVTAGATHRARIGENAFASVLPLSGLDKLEKLVLHLRNGTVEEFPL